MRLSEVACDWRLSKVACDWRLSEVAWTLVVRRRALGETGEGGAERFGGGFVAGAGARFASASAASSKHLFKNAPLKTGL